MPLLFPLTLLPFFRWGVTPLRFLHEYSGDVTIFLGRVESPNPLSISTLANSIKVVLTEVYAQIDTLCYSSRLYAYFCTFLCLIQTACVKCAYTALL